MRNYPTSEILDPSSSQSFTILLVDDDPLIRKLVKKVLEPDEYYIVEAKNGVEALAMYQDVQPDLVLLDGSMPIMDGFECCSHLRQKAPLQTLPILMITGLDDDKFVDAAFDAGATDYIHKPINWVVLRRRVQLLLKMGELHDRLTSTNNQLEAANQELKSIAYIDDLTNLFNRRSLDNALDREWNRYLEFGEPLSLIMCDVDCLNGLTIPTAIPLAIGVCNRWGRSFAPPFAGPWILGPATEGKNLRSS